ncbi:MAG: energy transducer TonB [Bryobacterales bacterium]|nr:energy transducer TonB [Bryobacterales bacterium]
MSEAPRNPNPQGYQHDPLERLLVKTDSNKSLFGRLFDNLREAFAPEKLPALDVTSKPVAVKGLGDDRPFWVRFKENFRDAFSTQSLPSDITSKPVAIHDELSASREPFWKSLAQNLKDLVAPEKLPPLELTSKPVAVKSMWGKSEYSGKSRAVSMAVHIGLVIIGLALGTNETVQNTVRESVTLVAPNLEAYMPAAEKPKLSGGGGGGGNNNPLPVNKGKLPRADLKQFTPPTQELLNPDPKLVMEPTVIAPPDAPLPQVNMANYGDPLSGIIGGPPSNGPGSGGGMGTGRGTGVGAGRGGGVGEGEGGGFGGGVFRVGGGVTSPVPVYKIEPEYSEEARKAKYQGTVVLSVIIDATGKPTSLKVVRPLGLGLDEKAIEAVRKWRFRPGTKEGKPVAVYATIEVNFRLL